MVYYCVFVLVASLKICAMEKADSPLIDKGQEAGYFYKNFIQWDNECSSLPFYRDNHAKKTEDLSADHILAGQYHAPAHKTHNKPKNLTAKEFERALDECAQTINDSINHENYWLYTVPHKDFFTLRDGRVLIYAQKLLLPESAVISCMGDLHGDYHSLGAYLKKLADTGYLSKTDPFKIEKPNFSMLFLGDYVDRGIYGVEVFYTLLRLKIANPDIGKVIMVRGNHEDIMINSAYGFVEELYKKFPERKDLIGKINNFYKLLPSVCYIGSRALDPNGAQAPKDYYFQACHGGLELGYLPNKLLENSRNPLFEAITKLNRAKNITFNPRLKDSPEFYQQLVHAGFSLRDIPLNPENQETVIGFMWNDFIVDNQEKILMPSRSEGIFAFGKKMVDRFLDLSSSPQQKYAVIGILRGHQHDNTLFDNQGKKTMMAMILDERYPQTKGVALLWRNKDTQTATLWPGIVCTFNVTPDTPYGDAHEKYGKMAYPGFDTATYGLLMLDSDIQKWRLQVENINPFTVKRADPIEEI